MRHFISSASTILKLALVLLLPLLSGCAYGLIYRDTTRPVVYRIKEANRQGIIAAPGDNYEVREPFTGYGLRVEWKSYAIGDIALGDGVDDLQYADVRIVSVLGGLWSRRTVTVYGRKSRPIS